LIRHFKPIIKLLKLIVENTVSEEFQPINKEVSIAKDISIKKKHKDNDNDDEFWIMEG